MDTLKTTQKTDIIKNLEDRDQLNSLWNTLFQKYLHLDNTITKMNDAWFPETIEKNKELLYVDIKINLKHEITGTLNHWYSWNIEVLNKNWENLFSISSPEPVYGLAKKNSDLIKSQQCSIVRHLWDYYKKNYNSEKLEEFLKTNGQEKQNELNVILGKF